jgi:lipid-A-disaccharide synthase
MDERPCILFTAFEPSGDEHAAPVVAELRRLLPGVPIWALGGRRMESAGAELIEKTTDDSAMLAGALSKVGRQLALRRRLKRWLDEHPVLIHVPTDSPAANWGICKMVKRRWGGRRADVSGLGDSTGHHSMPPLGRVVHLVCPQVWAWATWRVKRLIRWSDLTLCILPFEPAWLEKHGVRAKFIGHPLFDAPLDAEAMTWAAAGFPHGRPRVAMLPGSRPGEVSANWPIMRRALEILQQSHPHAAAVVAAAGDQTARMLREMPGDWPARWKLVTGQTDAALHWADVALTASGTATLHVARHRKPMTVLYHVPAWQWHAVGRWIIDTRTFTLPNLIAVGPRPDREGHIVREFVPLLGGVAEAPAVAAELASLADDVDKRQRQTAALDAAARRFDGHHAGREAAEAIAALIRESPARSGGAPPAADP